MFLLTRYRILSLIFLTTVFIPFYIGISRSRVGVNENIDSVKHLNNDADIEQKQRKTLITKTCHFLKINQTITDIPISHLDHLIVDDAHKLIYCYVPKVACTNWKRVLLSLQNSNLKDPLLIKGNETHQSNTFKTLNQYKISEIEEKLHSYWKFYFVRHPYERLLSAYRNKLEDSYVDYFRTRFGKEIIKKFRINPSKESLEKGHDVKFDEFIQYITSLDLSDWKSSLNEHWRPIFDLCFPCNIDYDLIGKYETLESDASYILKKIGLSDQVKFPNRQLSYKKQPTSELMHDYYRNISQELHQKLYEIYKEDFKLFNYDSLF